MKFGIIGLMALVFLSGCETVPSKAKPDIVKYPQSVMDKAADEIDGGSCPTLGDTFMPDYQVMRDQVRAL